MVNHNICKNIDCLIFYVACFIYVLFNLWLDLNLSSWSSTGGWMPNSFVFITKNACSEAKFVLRNVWLSMIMALNISSSYPALAVMYTNNWFLFLYILYYVQIMSLISLKLFEWNLNTRTFPLAYRLLTFREFFFDIGSIG